MSAPAAAIASTMARTTAGSRPSLKFGTASSRRAGLMGIENKGRDASSQAWSDPFAALPDLAQRRGTVAIGQLAVIADLPDREVRRRTRPERSGPIRETERPCTAGRCGDDRLQR